MTDEPTDTTPEEPFGDDIDISDVTAMSADDFIGSIADEIVARVRSRVPNPAALPMGLSEGEGRRGMALMLAIKYHTDNQVKDPNLLRELKMDPHYPGIRWVDYTRVVEIAEAFDDFLRGDAPGTLMIGDQEVQSGSGFEGVAAAADVIIAKEKKRKRKKGASEDPPSAT
jgi:hypothetical protein